MMGMATKEFTGAIDGIKNRIENLLVVKGFSQITVNEFMDMVERLIAYSGNLGKSIEIEKSYRAIQVCNDEILRLENENKKLKLELKKHGKTL